MNAMFTMLARSADMVTIALAATGISGARTTRCRNGERLKVAPHLGRESGHT